MDIYVAYIYIHINLYMCLGTILFKGVCKRLQTVPQSRKQHVPLTTIFFSSNVAICIDYCTFRQQYWMLITHWILCRNLVYDWRKAWYHSEKNHFFQTKVPWHINQHLNLLRSGFWGGSIYHIYISFSSFCHVCTSGWLDPVLPGKNKGNDQMLWRLKRAVPKWELRVEYVEKAHMG